MLRAKLVRWLQLGIGRIHPGQAEKESQGRSLVSPLPPIEPLEHRLLLSAPFHTWEVNELFSSLDGSVQFIELVEAHDSNFQHRFQGQTISSDAKSYEFESNLPSSQTANKKALLATAKFSTLPGAVTPDYVIEENFFSVNGDTVNFTDNDSLTFGPGDLPLDGLMSLGPAGPATNSPTNFAGDTGSINVPSRGQIHGTKWYDLDADGEPDAGETPLENWTIYLDVNRDGRLNNPVSGNNICDLNASEPCTLTDANGEYWFTDLDTGTYTVAEVLQDSWEQTFPNGDGTHNFDLAAGQIMEEVNFGNRLPGDVDGDGDVDFTDFSVLSGNFTGTLSAGTGDKTRAQGDFDGDGDVDFTDFSIVSGDFTGSEVVPARAQYEATFDATWSAETHPLDFPSNPHFSGLVGGTHDTNVTFWKLGGIATDGIESMAETGSKTILEGEVNAAIDSGDAFSLISGRGVNPSPGMRTETFEASITHPLVTLVTMIAPSPDWFVGVSGMALFANGQWRDEVVVELVGFDAGTDSGTTYTARNADITPHIPIVLLEDYAFTDGTPLGTFRFRRIG